MNENTVSSPQYHPLNYIRPSGTHSAVENDNVLNEGNEIEQQTDILYDPKGAGSKYRALCGKLTASLHKEVAYIEELNNPVKLALRELKDARLIEDRFERIAKEEKIAKKLDESIIKRGAAQSLFVKNKFTDARENISRERFMLMQAFPSNLFSKDETNRIENSTTDGNPCNETAKIVSQTPKEDGSIALSSVEKKLAFFKDYSGLIAELDFCTDEISGTIINANAIKGRIDNLRNQSQVISSEPIIVRARAVTAEDILSEPFSQSDIQKIEDIKSSWDICSDVADSIQQMEDEYLKIFQSATEKYAAFFKDFSALMGKLKDYIEAKDDKTILKAKAFRDLVDELLSKYSVSPPNDSTTLYSGSKEDCLAWAKEMGIDQNTCVVNSNGKYVVTIDMSALQNIRTSLEKYNDTMSCNAAEWQVWMSSTDTHKESIQNNMQVLAQKYTSANTTFDNLVKVLSSTISSLSEVDKAFINNLR